MNPPTTTPRLNPDHAGEIARLFGLGEGAQLTGPLAAGREGQVWRLTTDAGAFAVKEPFGKVDVERAEADTTFQEAALRGGAPLPRPVRTTDGQAIALVGGTALRVHSWVEFEPRTRDLVPAELEALGEIVARMHRAGRGIPSRVGPTVGPSTVGPSTVGPPTVEPWFSEALGKDRWWGLIADLERGGAPFAAGLADVVPDLLAAEAVIVPPRNVQPCHRDLWADNVLRSRTGGLVVLDWENSGPADPSYELMAVLFEFSCTEPHPPHPAQRVRTVYDAYVAAGGPGRISRPGDASMLIAVIGHLTEVACRRWLAATTDEEREDYAAWAGEGIADPVTVETVTSILDALA